MELQNRSPTSYSKFFPYIISDGHWYSEGFLTDFFDFLKMNVRLGAHSKDYHDPQN